MDDFLILNPETKQPLNVDELIKYNQDFWAKHKTCNGNWQNRVTALKGKHKFPDRDSVEFIQMINNDPTFEPIDRKHANALYESHKDFDKQLKHRDYLNASLSKSDRRCPELRKYPPTTKNNVLKQALEKK